MRRTGSSRRIPGIRRFASSRSMRRSASTPRVLVFTIERSESGRRRMPSCGSGLARMRSTINFFVAAEGGRVKRRSQHYVALQVTRLTSRCSGRRAVHIFKLRVGFNLHGVLQLSGRPAPLSLCVRRTTAPEEIT